MSNFDLDIESLCAIITSEKMVIEEKNVNRTSIYYDGKNPIFLHVNGPDKSDLDKFL